MQTRTTMKASISMACVGVLLLCGCGTEESSVQTIEATVTLSPTSPMERDVMVEIFERDPLDATAQAELIEGQKITQITSRGSRDFTLRLKDDMEYYFTARPDPALRCGADYEFDGEPSVFLGARAPSKVSLKLSSPDLLERCQ